MFLWPHVSCSLMCGRSAVGDQKLGVRSWILIQMTYIQLLEATSETLFSNRGLSRLWNKIKTQMCSSVAEGQGQLAAQSTKQGILSRKTELKHFLSWFTSDSIKQHSSYSRKCPRFLELQKLFPPKRRTHILLEIKES